MHPLAHQVRHPAHRKNIATAIQRNAVIKAQPLASLNLPRNGLKRRIVSLEGVAWMRDG